MLIKLAIKRINAYPFKIYKYMYFLKIIFNIFLFGYVNFLSTFAYINLIIMSNKEKLKEFKEKMENLISQMEDVLEMMPIKGNSSSDC
jgi:hypothetical protein